MSPHDIPQPVVDAFVSAWEHKRDQIGVMKSEPGTKTRAGLAAAFEAWRELGLSEPSDAGGGDV